MEQHTLLRNKVDGKQKVLDSSNEVRSKKGNLTFQIVRGVGGEERLESEEKWQAAT